MKIFSWDCETNGLWGRAFAIGAVVYEDGVEGQDLLRQMPHRG